jgi:GT2 family glycosyltransferase
MNQDTKSLSVIIVNYNSGDYAIECIRSLHKQENVNIEIIVIDNASRDNSVKQLNLKFGDEMVLIESKENLGFGRANNLGAGKATGEYLMLLNPDTVIPDSLGCFHLIQFLDAHPEIGMVGPAVEEPRKGKNVLPRFSYPSSRNLKYTTTFRGLPGDIAWILGACMLIKRSLYNEIAGFDPDYFLYGEDADICLRIRRHGYQIGYCEDVKIIHVSGASEIGAEPLDKWLRKRRGLYLFCKKHFDARDALSLARREIFKSSIYLFFNRFSRLFGKEYSEISKDKKNRQRATIIAAEELVQQLKH